jgi:hypothetical protein
MMYLILSTLVANAEDASKGYYNEIEISKASTLFSEASKVSAPQFAQAESNIRSHTVIIKNMEQNIALLKDDELQAWFADNQRYMIGYRMQVRKHASMLTEDYNTEFTNAMVRAIENVGFEGTVEVCQAQAIHAMMALGPNCEGTSLSKNIAKTMDSDAELKSAIASINGVPWPTPNITIEQKSPQTLTGTENFIQLDIFVDTMLKERMVQHQQWLERQNDDLIEDLENGDKEAFAKAEANRQEYLNRLTDDGDILQQALIQYAKKRGKKKPVLNSIGLCGNVKEMGGCSGKDTTTEVVELLKSDRYWAKLQAKSDL